MVRKTQSLRRVCRTAKQKLAGLLSERDEESFLNRDWTKTRFIVFAIEYLADVKARRTPATFRKYRELICRALKIRGTSILVGDLRRIYLSNFEHKMAGITAPLQSATRFRPFRRCSIGLLKISFLKVPRLLALSNPRRVAETECDSRRI